MICAENLPQNYLFALAHGNQKLMNTTTKMVTNEHEYNGVINCPVSLKLRKN